MLIRGHVLADRQAIDEVVAGAFSEPVDGRVVEMMQALEQSGASRANLVAVDSGTVVGHVRLSRGWIDARDRLVPALILSPLAVVPTRQGHGIGTQLVTAALDEADTQGAPAVFLEGSPSYYGSRGFSRASDHGFERPSPRIPDPGFQVAFGASYETSMKGRVVYPEAFWVTDTVGLRDPRLSEVEKQIERER